MHPMTQLKIGLLACQPESKFARAYQEGTRKTEYWDPVYDDIISVISKLPKIASLVYRCTYHDGKIVEDRGSDFSGNFCRMLGYNDPSFDELMRLYMVIHSDHEGLSLPPCCPVTLLAFHRIFPVLAGLVFTHNAPCDGQQLEGNR